MRITPRMFLALTIFAGTLGGGSPLWDAGEVLWPPQVGASWSYAGEAPSGELTGKEVIDRVVDRPQPTRLRAKFQMILQNSRGEKRQRSVELVSSEDAQDLRRAMIRFQEPADVKGTGFLVLEQKEGDDVQILYLPALKKTRRISSSQKSQSFMGTDFSYEDMSATDVDRDGAHTLLRSETIDGQECAVVESIPAASADSSYSRIINWVRRDIWVPVKAEFYDKDGKLLKVMTVRSVEKVGDYWFITQSQMHNVQKDHRTFLLTPAANIEVDPELSDDLFTERALAAE